MYGKWNSQELINISAVEISREGISDKSRTIGGQLRKDIVAIKRAWQIQCIYLTKTEADAILDEFATNLYGEGDFWLYEFGLETSTVKAMVDENSVQEVLTPYTDHAGTRQKDGRSLVFVVEEV